MLRAGDSRIRPRHIRAAASPRLAKALGHRQHRRQALLGVSGDPHGGGLLAPFVQRPLDLLGQHARLLGVQLDPGDAEPAAAELDAAGPGQAQLDPRPLQLQQVLGRLRQRPEAVAELVADRPQLARLARRDDAPVDVDLRRLEGDEGGRQVGVDGDVEADRLRRLLARPSSPPASATASSIIWQ